MFGQAERATLHPLFMARLTSTDLLGMRERVELTGGEFTIKSAPNQSTTVKTVWLNRLRKSFWKTVNSPRILQRSNLLYFSPNGADWQKDGHPNQKGLPVTCSNEQSLQTSCQTQMNRIRYLTFSLSVLPTLNLTTFAAGILIFAPAPGLWPSVIVSTSWVGGWVWK